MQGSNDTKSSVKPDDKTDTELVPGVRKELASYQDADIETQQCIETCMSEIDIHDSSSIIFFGAKAQQQLTTISDQMLEGVRNKDVGPAGSALNEMVVTLRGFDVDELNPNRKQGFFSKLFGGAKPIVAFLAEYEEVRNHIDKISDELEHHKTNLLTDITKLNRLYDATLEYFHDLEFYIGAGEEKLRRLDQEIIPALEQEVSETEEMIKAQQLRDLRANRDDLERRVHDLKLTRQVTLQGLPSIRLVQENDKGLVNKINSTMVNTIPLWRQQLAQGVTIYRSSKAAETVKAASDLTNELLMANAENLKQATTQVRKQMERGVFDIEVVKQANETLITTIEESLQIADEGKRRRAEAEKELHTLEHELRKSLAAASARASGASTK